MSYGYDEFESKLGQFIYTMVMYERLREYLLERLRGKDRLNIRLNLGEDKAGNQVFMDVVLTAVKPQLLKPQDRKEPGKRKKSIVLILSSEEVEGDKRQIESEIEHLIKESLKWWHGYFGERDKLRLDTWWVDRAELFDVELSGLIVEIPVNRVVMPPPIQVTGGGPEEDVLTEFADILAPIAVRPLGNEMYELVSGHRLYNVLVNRLGCESIKAVLLEVDDARAASIRAEVEEKTNKLLKTISRE